MPHDVIMPALGMTQDSGLILSWKKEVGDEVDVGDILMEVETDKAAVEVEAQNSGVLLALHAEEGTDVPVGEVVAIIGDETELAVSPRSSIPSEPSSVENDSMPPTEEIRSRVEKKESTPAEANRVNHRILASPKAKRLAKERGLDLRVLVRSGHPQPYHVSDLEHLISLTPSCGSTMNDFVRALTDGAAFKEFSERLKREFSLPVSLTLAAFAAGAYRSVTTTKNITVRVDSMPDTSSTYTIPDCVGLTRIEQSESALQPDLIVFDLTSTRLVEIRSGPTLVPTFVVTWDSNRIETALMVPQGLLNQGQLVNCMEGFIGRLEQPLRHLL